MIETAKTIWPQILVLSMFTMAFVRCVALHGQPTPVENYNAAKFGFGLILAFFILGMGGFWKPLGW